MEEDFIARLTAKKVVEVMATNFDKDIDPALYKKVASIFITGMQFGLALSRMIINNYDKETKVPTNF